MRGMGLLPAETVFSAQKERTRVIGSFPRMENDFKKLSGAAFEGYEIHMGQSYLTENCGTVPAVWKQGDRLLGMSIDHALGTYVHGLLDREETASALVAMLAGRKGITISEQEVQDFHSYKEKQYQKLAQELRPHLDMGMIYHMMGMEAK